MLDGEVQFNLNVRCLMGSDKGEFCHSFCLMYMDDLSVNLKKCPTGCIAGGTVVNNLMYAGDIVGHFFNMATIQENVTLLHSTVLAMNAVGLRM